MLLNVLTSVAADTGYEPVQQRSTLLELLNRSAKDLYNMLECNKILRETTLVVPPDSVVALPSFIGELRGLRMHTNELPFDLHSMSAPRYVNNTLGYKYKNWRDLGDSCVNTLPSTVGVLKFTCPNVDNVSVLVAGQTDKANRIEETVDLIADPLGITTGAQGISTNLFGPRIDVISCFSNRTADITVKDANNVQIATLYNTDNKTRYKLVDVSQVFWTLDTSAGESFIDVLYKVPFYRLTKDTDSFFAGDDYDNAWYYYTMHHFLKVLQGREAEAQQMLAAAISAVQAAKDGSEQQIMKKLIFGRQKFYGIFKKYRYYPGSVTNVDHNNPK